MSILLWAGSATAAGPSVLWVERYQCDGDPLLIGENPGAVDAPGIPNSNGDTLPGSLIILEWRGARLQLPRTNNAGVPSYSDGRWWWQAQDPDHPDFAERRANWQTFSCERSYQADPDS